jgi:hypothetical protein
MADLTPGELFRLYRMYNIRQAKEWERARFVAWFSTLPYRSKGDNSSPYDIMKLETDPDEEELKKYQDREHEEALELIREYKERGLI